MAKIKLTKNELKKKKDALKMYKRYLPTLQLKKQQLQMEIRLVENRLAQLVAAKEALERQFSSWVAVFSEEEAAREKSGIPLLSLTLIKTSMGNIAGVVIPVFEGADFNLGEYDFFEAPLWVDRALELMKQVLLTDAESRLSKGRKRCLPPSFA